MIRRVPYRPFEEALRMKITPVALAIALATTSAHAQTIRVCRDDLGQITTFAKPHKDYAGLGWYPAPDAKLAFGTCRDQEMCEFLSSLQSGCFERNLNDNEELMTYLTLEQ
jgi:hypothetical protein